MAQYLLPIAGHMPTNFDWLSVVQAVYNELRTPEAISDLSLPPLDFWGNAAPLLRPVFQLIENNQDVGQCYTEFNFLAGEWQSVVRYTNLEYQSCPQLIMQRFCHEITHGLRRSIVQCTFDANPQTRDKYVFTTLPKAPKKRKFRSMDKLFMDHADHRFHSGYWMEHRLYGGIAVGLTGKFYTDERSPATSMVQVGHNDVRYFRIRRCSTNVRHDGDLYVKTTGYMYNEETRAFEDALSVIFHCGSRITGTGEH